VLDLFRLLGHRGWLPDRDGWGVGIILTMRPDVAAGFATVVIVGGVPTGIGQQSPTLYTVRTEAMGHRGGSLHQVGPVVNCPMGTP
jgi:hypothetical protein